MTDRINGGSPVVHPQQYYTVPTAVIDGAQRRDRYLNQSEIKALSAFLQTGLRRLEIAQTLAQQSDAIVAAGGKRIFVGGNPMAYFEKPEDPIGLPGSGYYVAEDYLSAKGRVRKEQKQQTQPNPASPTGSDSPIAWFKGLFFSGKPSVPSSFRAISISEYGPVRMKRSMRDLGWFLRYVTYALVAGDTSIISVNTRGLRGVIPEDVTLATAVALREMQWKALSYFPTESAAANLVKQYFDVLIADYCVEKPSDRLRTGVSKHQQGLSLPPSYEESSHPTPRWEMKATLSDMEKDAVIKAAYQQVFERDVTQMHGGSLSELVSQVKSGQRSMQGFIQALGRSRLYRRLFYEPYTISRSIELACRHFLGRGLGCMEEFQTYFELVADQGFFALVDTFVNSQEYVEYFGEETVPYLRGLGLEAQACRNWGPQLELFKYSAAARKVPQFVTTFAGYQQPLPNQHPYGTGNDPLEIQFGAIFAQENRDPKAQPAHFREDSRRILIGSGGRKGYPITNKHSLNTHSELGRIPGSLEHTFALPPQMNPAHSLANGTKNGSQPVSENPPSFNSTQHSVEAVILAAYRQVFGRAVLESQRHTMAETRLKGGLITVREFVRELAKSKAFRRAYWENLYMTKAAEIIHRRLLGRPTYGRRETSRYYDICGRQGFYALVDALIDSDEYISVFGESTVPYERYVTPRGLAMRSPQGPAAWSKPRENPDIIAEYMMRYQPPTGKRPASSLQSEHNGQQAADNSPSETASQDSQPTPIPSEETAQEESESPVEAAQLEASSVQS